MLNLLKMDLENLDMKSQQSSSLASFKICLDVENNDWTVFSWHNETYLWLLLKDDNTTPFVSSG